MAITGIGVDAHGRAHFTTDDKDGMTSTYKIVRHFARGGKRTIKTGLTLEQAQAHTNDPETASNTARSARMRRYTEERGPWFDGYWKED